MRSGDYYFRELVPMPPLREVRRTSRCRELRERRKGQFFFGVRWGGAVFRRCEDHAQIFARPASRPGDARRRPGAPRKHPKLPISGAHGVVASHPLSMREALGSIPSVSMHSRGQKSRFRAKHSQKQAPWGWILQFPSFAAQAARKARGRRAEGLAAETKARAKER